MTLYTERFPDQTNHFADVFVRKNVAYGDDVVTTLWRRYDVRKYTADTIPVSENGQFNVLAAFSVRIWLK